MELFEHNKDVFKIMEDYLNTKNKCILVLGTCLGKTSTALAYIEKYNLNALILAPNLTITDSWNEYKNITTMTYQAFAQNYQALNFSKFGIIVCDEVHHAGAKEWGKGIRYILDNTKIKVLGLTATNVRGDGIDIADELFKDCIATGLTVLEGIKEGILNGLKYVNAYYNLEEIKETEEEIDNEILRKNLNLALNKTPTVQSILRKNMPEGKRKGIIFVSNQEDIEKGKEIILDAFPKTEVRILHSSETENNKTRDWFKNTDEGFIISQNMINEGAHYKGVNTLIMLRRTGSSLLYYQQIGRVLSLSKYGDNKAIVFDLVNNNKTISLINSFREDEEFQKEIERQERMTKDEQQKFIDSIPNQIIVEDYTSELDEILEEIRKSLLTNRFWDFNELQILKENFDKGKTFLINKLSNRTWEAILAKASEIGIKIKTESPRDYQWTEYEDNIIKKYYKLEGYHKISKRLPNRNEKSIMQRASKLGIKMNKYLSDSEINNIIKLYPIYGSVKTAEIMNKNRKTIERYARDLNINGPKIWSEDEKEIIKKYYPIYGTDVLKMIPEKQKSQLLDYCSRHKIKYTPKLKKIHCIETGIIYDNAKLASESIKKSESFIRQACCNGNLCAGYHWEYIMDEINDSK